MLDTIPRVDMARRPERQHLRFLIWALCQPTLWRHRTQLKKIDMEGVKPPYLLLCNHNAFMDFKVASRATFPHRANYVVAIDGFIGREWLLRFIGCICKRKFTRDTVMVRHRGDLSRGALFALRHDGGAAGLDRQAREASEGPGRDAHLQRAPYQFSVLESAGPRREAHGGDDAPDPDGRGRRVAPARAADRDHPGGVSI